MNCRLEEEILVSCWTTTIRILSTIYSMGSQRRTMLDNKTPTLKADLVINELEEIKE